MPRPSWSIVLRISTLIAAAVVATTGHKVTYDELIETTTEIIRCCAKFSPDDTILLAGEYEDFFQRSQLHGVPIALISESRPTPMELFILSRHSFTVFEQFSFLEILWKLNHFVVIASSQPMLRLLLLRIKDSTWANSMGFHILIDKKTEERGCVNAYRYLWAAWKFDRLSTIFLCIDPVDGLVLYTYNPYSSMAPKTWNHAGWFKGRAGHPWLLLKKKYRHGSSSCDDLTFDKTRDLNGYEVRLNAISYAPHLQIDESKPGLDKFTGDNSEIVKIVFKKLNASLNVRVYNGTRSPDLGGIDNYGNSVGLLADVSTGEVDIGMNERHLHVMWKIEYTYPHGDGGLCVVTRRAGEISKFMKILSLLPPILIAGNVVVFAFALCILAKYQGFALASLNLIRIITSVSMRKLPGGTFSRIFFSQLLLLYVVMNALIETNRSSLLTVSVSQPNIETPEDLKKSDCQIYGSMFYGQILQDRELRLRFHEDTYHGCRARMLRSQCAACLGDCLHLYVRIQDEPVHRSRRIQENMQAFVARENWPLINRVTEVILTIMEAGLVSMWKQLNTRKTFLAWKKQQLKLQSSFRNLEFEHISFTVYILAIGYFCAAVAFFVEILVGKKLIRRLRRS